VLGRWTIGAALSFPFSPSPFSPSPLVEKENRSCPYNARKMVAGRNKPLLSSSLVDNCFYLIACRLSLDKPDKIHPAASTSARSVSPATGVVWAYLITIFRTSAHRQYFDGPFPSVSLPRLPFLAMSAGRYRVLCLGSVPHRLGYLGSFTSAGHFAVKGDRSRCSVCSALASRRSASPIVFGVRVRPSAVRTPKAQPQGGFGYLDRLGPQNVAMYAVRL